MAYQVLARKYRPQHFSDVIGQDHVTRTLQNALAQGRIAHGYIFSGHRGIGKTTIARILAMALNCHGPNNDAAGPQQEPCGVCDSCTEIRAGSSVDVIEIDAATNRGIDEIRELRDAARYRPARDRFKIYILDEAHQITDAAFNALLKTLEEPPAHIVFMMATTQPEDFPQTIRSRCQNYSFHAVRFDDIVAQLTAISAKENIDAEPEALAMVAEAGDGSMRDALSIMDQAIASGEYSAETQRVRLTAAQIRDLVGTVSSEVLERFMESVSKGSSVEVLNDLDRLLTEGQSPTHFARQFVRYLRNVLVAKVAGAESYVLQISQDERNRVTRTAALFTEEDLTRYMNIMLRTFDELGYKQEQRFHLELGLLKLVHAQRLLPMEQFLSAQPAPAARPSATQPTSPQPRPSPSAASPFGTPSGTSRTPAPAPPASSSQSTPAANPFAKSSSTESQRPSPFESDRNRKAGMSAANTATAVAVAPAATLVEEAPPITPQEDTELLSSLRVAVLTHLTQAGHSSLAETFGEGEWSFSNNDVQVKVAMPAAGINVIVTQEIRRDLAQVLTRTANLGRALKIAVVPGLTEPVKAATNGHAPVGSAASRAAEDPLVQHFKKVFNAEIRTVIDQRKG